MDNQTVANSSAVSGVQPREEPYYNILSLDGGGIRGLISATCVKLFEEEAYDYCTDKGYNCPIYPDRPGVIHMKDLFNMTAGTSTGSIISAGLSYPKNDEGEPQYFA